MLTRKAKQFFFHAAAPLLSMSGQIHRLFRASRRGGLRVQLGPGQSNYIDGWINVDANAFTGKVDVWADLRNPLPFNDGTVTAMYSHHVVEHLPDIAKHLADVLRCLEPGGVYRMGGPNGDGAIQKFVEGDSGWFGDFPDTRKSIGGRFENFIFCRQEHLTILTFSYLEELMNQVGFIDIQKCLPVRQTNYPELFAACLSMEYEDDFATPHTLIVEAKKPPLAGRSAPKT